MYTEGLVVISLTDEWSSRFIKPVLVASAVVYHGAQLSTATGILLENKGVNQMLQWLKPNMADVT